MDSYLSESDDNIEDMPSEPAITESLKSQSEMSIDEQLNVELDHEVQHEEVEEPLTEPVVVKPTPKAESPILVISELPSSILPSNGNIVQYYRFIISTSSGSTIDTISHQIALEVEEIWKTAHIPTFEFKYIKKQIKTVIGKMLVFRKHNQFDSIGILLAKFNAIFVFFSS